MTRQTRLMVLALVALFVAPPALSPFAQSANGVRIIAPRTVEMMRTNHVNPDPLKTMPQGTGWGMDFQIVMDAAAAGDSAPNGTYSWFGIAGTWFWIDPVDDLAFVGMVQHVNLGTTRGIHGLSRSLVYQSIMN